MPKTFKVSFGRRLGNAVISALLRMGITMGTMSLLTVKGRKSGQPRTIPVTLIEQDGQRWLVSPYGAVQWVRNLRAAGTAVLTRNRRSETISVTEVTSQEAAPILKQYITQIGLVRPFFDATPDSAVEAFELEAARHPVFLITTQDI